MPPPGPMSPRAQAPPVAQVAAVTVKVNVRVAVLVAFVAVIVYAVEPATAVGVPDNKPVDVLNVKPVGADGLIA